MKLKKLVNKFNWVCEGRKLKVNPSKVMVFEEGESEVVNCALQYRINRNNKLKWRGCMMIGKEIL